VLNWIRDFAMRKGYALAQRKGVSCPDCGQGVVLPEVMPVGGLKGRFCCGRCEWTGSLLDTMEFGRAPESVLEEKPVGCRVLKEANRWVIPGTGKVEGEFVFAVVWLCFISFFLVMILWKGGEGDDVEPIWVGLLLLVPFFAVGFWLLYLGYGKMRGVTEVRINSADVKVTKRLFWFLKEERIPRRQVAGVSLDFSYDSESGRSADLMIQRGEGKPVKVDLEVSVDEKRWLLGEWREELGLEVVEKVERRRGTVAGDFEGKAIQVKGVELEPKENGIFFLTVRNRVAPWLMVGGGFMVAVGVAMAWPGFHGGDDDAPGIFRVVGMLFQGVGILFSLIPLLGGAGALIWGLRTFGEARKYAFYPDRIEFAKVKRGGRITGSESWGRESVTDVVVSHSGESNGGERFRVQLRAERNVNLVTFASGEVAEELEGWVRNWIEVGRGLVEGVSHAEALRRGGFWGLG
jgi:ribosomal protein S27AE